MQKAPGLAVVATGEGEKAVLKQAIRFTFLVATLPAERMRAIDPVQRRCLVSGDECSIIQAEIRLGDKPAFT